MNLKNEPIQRGARVKMHLDIRLGDGTEVLSSLDDQPLEFSLGDGTLAPGLEDLIVGLRAGADARFLAEGSAIYGPRDDANIHWLSRTEVPADLGLTRGQILAFEAPGGQEVAGRLLELDADQMKVDFNHPLSGHSLQIRAIVLSATNPGAAAAHSQSA